MQTNNDKKNEELLKRLYKAEVELELWHAGRLSPKGEG